MFFEIPDLTEDLRSSVMTHDHDGGAMLIFKRVELGHQAKYVCHAVGERGMEKIGIVDLLISEGQCPLPLPSPPSPILSLSHPPSRATETTEPALAHVHVHVHLVVLKPYQKYQAYTLHVQSCISIYWYF